MGIVHRADPLSSTPLWAIPTQDADVVPFITGAMYQHGPHGPQHPVCHGTYNYVNGVILLQPFHDFWWLFHPAYYGSCTMEEQTPDIPVTPFADAQVFGFATTAYVFWHHPEEG